MIVLSVGSVVFQPMMLQGNQLYSMNYVMVGCACGSFILVSFWANDAACCFTGYDV